MRSLPPQSYRAASVVALLLVLASCGFSNTYDVEGRVVGFGDDGRTVIVEHGDVPGLMPAMTMPFKAADPGAVQRLRTGEAVAFRLHVSRDSSWITDVVSLPDDALPRHPAGEPLPASTGRESPVLAEGDAVPAFHLLTQTGDTLRPADLGGRAWLLTFIYTRCPLPEYCPLLSQKFSQLQAPLAARFGDRAHLVSISFDPAHDTPAVLRDYARQVGADPARWTFVTGDESEIRELAGRFGVFYQTAGGEILHNLVTALVGPDGSVRAMWPGNDWTTAEALAAVEAALETPAP